MPEKIYPRGAERSIKVQQALASGFVSQHVSQQVTRRPLAPTAAAAAAQQALQQQQQAQQQQLSVPPHAPMPAFHVPGAEMYPGIAGVPPPRTVPPPLPAQPAVPSYASLKAGLTASFLPPLML